MTTYIPPFVFYCEGGHTVYRLARLYIPFLVSNHSTLSAVCKPTSGNKPTEQVSTRAAPRHAFTRTG